MKINKKNITFDFEWMEIWDEVFYIYEYEIKREKISKLDIDSKLIPIVICWDFEMNLNDFYHYSGNNSYYYRKAELNKLKRTLEKKIEEKIKEIRVEKDLFTVKENELLDKLETIKLWEYY